MFAVESFAAEVFAAEAVSEASRVCCWVLGCEESCCGDSVISCVYWTITVARASAVSKNFFFIDSVRIGASARMILTWMELMLNLALRNGRFLLINLVRCFTYA